jgi:hypothetical protein
MFILSLKYQQIHACYCQGNQTILIPCRATTAKVDSGRHNSCQGVEPVDEGVSSASDGDNVHESSKSALE